MADIDTDVTDVAQPGDSGEEVTEPLAVDETEDETGDQENEAANHEPSAEGENESDEKEEEEEQPTVTDDDQPLGENFDEVADGIGADEVPDDKGADDGEENVAADENVTTDVTEEEDDEHFDEEATKSPEQDETERDDDAEETLENNQGDSNNTEETFTISEEDKIKCRRLFDKKAINDRLNLAGLKAVFRLMGQILSSSQADQIFEEADRDGDETVDFEEFCRLYSKYGLEEENRSSILLHSVDKLFKCNQDGEVDLSEVEQVLLKLQQPGSNSMLVREKSDLGPEDIRSLVKAMDRDGNGRISKKEFVHTLCQHIEG